MKFQHPFSAIIVGSSGTGKTWLTRSFLEDYRSVTTITKPRLKVLWCHGQTQDLHKVPIPGVDITYREEFISEFDDERPDIVIYDDLMNEISNNKELTNVFTKKRHHLGISVVFLIQNLFVQSKEMRTISLNVMYFVLLKNPRDRLQILALGRQIYAGHQAFFSKVVDEALKLPYSHLVIDMTSQCDEDERLRQRVKDGERKGWYVWRR